MILMVFSGKVDVSVLASLHLPKFAPISEEKKGLVLANSLA